jgi:hypothetical protein
LNDATAILLVLGLFWAFVTVLGHGTWVLLARIFGSHRPAAPPTPRSTPAQRAATPDAALRSLQQQLAEYARAGILKEETYTALRLAIDKQQQWLEADALASKATTVTTSPVAEQAIASDLVPAETSTAALTPTPSTSSTPSAPSTPARPVSTEERVRQYAASRAMAAMEAAAEPKPPAPPKQREALSRLFAAFME